MGFEGIKNFFTQKPEGAHVDKSVDSTGRKREVTYDEYGNRINDVFYRPDGTMEKRKTLDPVTHDGVTEYFDEEGKLIKKEELKGN